MAREHSLLNRLTSFHLTIDGLQVNAQDIEVFTIETELMDTSYQCVLVIEDKNTGLVNLNSTSIIQIIIEDKHSNKYTSENFTIVALDVAFEENLVKRYTISFMDTLSFNLINNFSTKMYKDKKPNEIINDILKTAKDTGKKNHIDDTGDAYKQFLKPSLISDNRIIKQVCVDNGLVYFRRLGEFNCMKMEDIMKVYLHEEYESNLLEFVITSIDSDYSAVEWNISMYDNIDNLMITPDTDVYTVNHDDKKIQKTQLYLENVIKPLTMNSNVVKSKTTTLGKQTKAGFHNKSPNIAKVKYENILLNTTQLTFTMNGDLRIDCGKIVDVKITKYNSKGVQELDPEMSGWYLITEVDYHFPGGIYFTQTVQMDKV